MTQLKKTLLDFKLGAVCAFYASIFKGVPVD
jgi:hypothetical protein